LINVLADANRKAMDKIREEEPDMGNYFRELFKDDLEKQWNDGVAKGEEIANIKNIRNLMETTKMNAEAAMNALKIPSNEVPKYLAML
ncbi:MAG: hypothetical protein MSA77_09450, partial [Selenomonadales bacterium]|nr:hypothetical protein [Selenomonadales bacterium]